MSLQDSYMWPLQLFFWVKQLSLCPSRAEIELSYMHQKERAKSTKNRKMSISIRKNNDLNKLRKFQHIDHFMCSKTTKIFFVSEKRF